MSQRYNGKTKRPKLQDTQLGILKIFVFCQKIDWRSLGPGESGAGVMYLSMSRVATLLETPGNLRSSRKLLEK